MKKPTTLVYEDAQAYRHSPASTSLARYPWRTVHLAIRAVRTIAGFAPTTNSVLEEKLRALDRPAQIGLDVTIVPAIERGINKHEIGRLVDFAIEHPAIRGVTFQPAFHAGRHFAHDSMKRMTIPEIVRLIEAQTAGKFVASDFVPVPCCFPTCNSVTYAFVEDGNVTPLPRIVDVGEYLDYVTNRIVPDFSREVRTALAGLWSSSSVAGSDAAERRAAISCQTCERPDGLAINGIVLLVPPLQGRRTVAPVWPAAYRQVS